MSYSDIWGKGILNSSNLWCKECKYYKPIEDPLEKEYDVLCTAGYRVNGKLVKKEYKTKAHIEHGSCSQWVHGETGLTEFEVVCRKPESWRTPIEIEHLRQYVDWKE